MQLGVGREEHWVKGIHALTDIPGPRQRQQITENTQSQRHPWLLAPARNGRRGQGEVQTPPHHHKTKQREKEEIENRIEDKKRRQRQ
jgi:hypothetical protein